MEDEMASEVGDSNVGAPVGTGVADGNAGAPVASGGAENETASEVVDGNIRGVPVACDGAGVETASESYFNKPASSLTLAESAMMAGLIQAPEVYSPFIDYKLAKQRQAVVLKRMRDLQWITPEEEAAG